MHRPVPRGPNGPGPSDGRDARPRDQRRADRKRYLDTPPGAGFKPLKSTFGTAFAASGTG